VLHLRAHRLADLLSDFSMRAGHPDDGRRAAVLLFNRRTHLKNTPE